MLLNSTQIINLIITYLQLIQKEEAAIYKILNYIFFNTNYVNVAFIIQYSQTKTVLFSTHTFILHFFFLFPIFTFKYIFNCLIIA